MTTAPDKPRAGRIALVGRPNVGKSTLLNAILGEPIAITSPHPQTTRDAVRGVLTVGDTQFVFVDTPGLHAAKTRLGERMNLEAREQAREADAVVLVVDVSAGTGDKRHEGPTTAVADEADLALARELPASPPVVLALNKIDRVKDKAALLAVLAAFSATRAFEAVVPISARRADGVDRLLAELAKLLPEQPWLFEDGTLSDQPVRFFVAELVREQILAHTRQEVPHGVAVVVERFDDPELGVPARRVARIELAIHVARESHKGIVVGAGGRMLKAIGSAARERVEKMLGHRVHLEIRVRATPDWMNDAAKLREMGYGPRDV